MRNGDASVIARQPTEFAHYPGKHQRRHFLRRSSSQAHVSSTHHTRTSQHHIRTSHVSRSHPLHGPARTTAEVGLKQLHTLHPSRRQRHSQLTPTGDQSNASLIRGMMSVTEGETSIQLKRDQHPHQTGAASTSNGSSIHIKREDSD